MSITFNCTHCQARMSVPDKFAGQRGKCSKCKGMVLVPGSNNGTAPPPPPQPGEDLEAAALSALSDEPKQQEQATDFVEFICPQCDEPVKLALEHAGKKHPCPSCRRIIPVPRPAKKDPANWRDKGPSLPSAAKRDVGPAPEDAWGTGTVSGPSEQSLRDAGVIQAKRKPLTLLQRLTPYMIFLLPLLFLLSGGWWAWSWMNQMTEKSAFTTATKMVESPKGADLVGEEGLAALHAGIGHYLRRTEKTGSASKARDEYQNAVTRAGKSRNPERDGLLIDLLEPQLGMIGTKADQQSDVKRSATEMQKYLAATLRAIADPQAKLEGLRRMTALLLAAKESGRILPITMQVFSAADADRYEALATVALELLKAGNQELGMDAAKQALAPYEPKEDKDKKGKAALRPDLRAAIVGLSVLLDRPPLVAGKSQEEVEAVIVGNAMGLARRGKLSEAREVETKGNLDVVFRKMLEIAAATGDKGDINAAIDALGQVGANRAKLGWAALRPVELAMKADLGADRIDVAANAAPPPLNAWGQLLALRARLAASRGVEPLEVLDKLPPQTLAGKVARLELAWHNEARQRGWSKAVKGWEEGPRAFGSLGVALGMQGK